MSVTGSINHDVFKIDKSCLCAQICLGIITTTNKTIFETTSPIYKPPEFVITNNVINLLVVH